jgi:hypothetical protein
MSNPVIPMTTTRRALPLLAAVLAPSAALAVPIQAGADAALIEAANEVVAALAAIARGDATRGMPDDVLAELLEALDDAYGGAVARLLETGPPETPAGLAALAQAVAAALRYEVCTFHTKTFAEQAEPHEAMALALADSVTAVIGRIGA